MTKAKPRLDKCEHCLGPLPTEGRARRFCTKSCADKAWKARNPDRAAEVVRRWVSENPERSRAIKKKHRDENRELINAGARALTDYSKNYQRAQEIHGREVVLKRVRARGLRIRYGLTEQEYDELSTSQGGVCAICGNPCPSGRRLAVDHDHGCCPGRISCGKCLRGLLCTPCNQHLGILEDVEWIKAAQQYLAAHKAQGEASDGRQERQGATALQEPAIEGYAQGSQAQG